jgi:hypothetical protein
MLGRNYRRLLRAVTLLCRRAEGTVLTPRNVQAFRTIFNITHALFELLGPKGWHLVLSTLAVLDEVLCSPATKTLQKETTASAEPEKHSELSVLDTATAQLFATTALASNATVDIMMQTLLSLSQSTLEHVQVCLLHVMLNGEHMRSRIVKCTLFSQPISYIFSYDIWVV